jgi:hypothetical protein
MTSATGQAVNRNTFNSYGWKPALTAAGFPATRSNGCHVLRHTFASVLLHDGVDVRALTEYLGHHDPKFTLRTYTHLMPAAHDRMRDRMRDAIDQAASDRGPSGHTPGDAQARAAAGHAHYEDHGPATAQAGVR